DALADLAPGADPRGVQLPLPGEPGEAGQAYRLPAERRGGAWEFQRPRGDPGAGAGARPRGAARPRARRLGAGAPGRPGRARTPPPARVRGRGARGDRRGAGVPLRMGVSLYVMPLATYLRGDFR